MRSPFRRTDASPEPTEPNLDSEYREYLLNPGREHVSVPKWWPVSFVLGGETKRYRSSNEGGYMPLFGRSAMPRERRTARALAVFLVVSLQIFAQFTRESNRAPELGETKGSKRIGVQVAGRASLRGRLKGSNLASFLSSMVTDNKGAHHSSNQTVEEKKELDGISGVKKRAEATITIASRRAPRVLSRKHKIK
eukprot:1337266-Amorphochlora_amoeboformis.AAC.1